MGRQREGLRLAVVLALLAWGLPSRPASAQAFGCCTPVPVVTNLWSVARQTEGGDLWIGADGARGVYGGWADTGANSAMLLVSHDDGGTWSGPTAILPTGDLTFKAAVDQDGILVIAYPDGGQVWVTVSRDGAGTFSAPVAVGAATGPTYRPALSLGDAGLTAVAWSTTDDTQSTTPGMWVAVSPDRGATWQPATRLDAAPSGWTGYRTYAVCASSGHVVAGWWETDTASRTFVRSTGDLGMTWSAPVPGDTCTGGQEAQWIDLASTTGNTFLDDFVCAVPGDTTGDLHVDVSNDAGASWTGGDSDLGSGSAVEDAVMLAFPDGHVHVAWMLSGNLAVANVSPTSAAPGTWLASPVVLAPQGYNTHHLRLASSPDGSVACAHEDYRDRNTCPGQCESVYVNITCDHGVSWLEVEGRADTDQAPDLYHSEDPELAISSTGRLHALWTEVDSPEHLREAGLDPPPPPTPDITVTDNTPGPCSPPQYHLEVPASSIPGCASPTYQWLIDGAQAFGATSSTYDPDPLLAPGTHQVSCLVTCAPPRYCSTGTRSVALDYPPPPPPPQVAASMDPATDCVPEAWHLVADPTSLGTCVGPSFQWYLGGAPIPGATGSTYDVPTSTPPGVYYYSFVVSCTANTPCVDTATAFTVVVDPPPASRVTGVELVDPIYVRRDPPSLMLTWRDATTAATGYDVYRGTISSLWVGRAYDHAGDTCHVARAPSGPVKVDAPFPAPNSYYLVVPADCLDEGITGPNSLGRARSLAGSGSPCGPMP